MEVNSRRDIIKCPKCNVPVANVRFKTKKNKEEYVLSGLCQTCQDFIFGGDNL